jgi:signal transduction histidine kinase
MKIKDRLALYFTLSSILIMLMLLSAIYFTFLKFLEADFFARLTDRTMVTAKLYLEADEISRDSLNKVRNLYLEKLNGEVIRIYNAKNNPAFIGDDQQYWSNSIINKVRDAGKLRFKDGERQVVGIYYKDNQGDFVIIASAVDQSTHSRLDKLLRIMLVIFIIVFAGLLLSGRWIAKKILNPLDLFIDEVKQIKSNNLHFRVREGKNKDEIHLLAQNFNNLMEHLEQAFVLQRTFVANASHELRTPLTRMTISAELALSQEREKKDYQQALTSVLEDTGKMEGIITGLVNLAQADLEFASSQLSPVRIDEILWALQTEWKQRANFNLLIEMKNISGNEAELMVEGNPVLLHIALNNIVSNAFKFSDNKPVKCLLEVQENEIIIVVKDEGTGIPSHAVKEIFEPFYSAATESRHSGNGMGLYMTQKIVTLYKGSISVLSKEGPGTTIKITFPEF